MFTEWKMAKYRVIWHDAEDDRTGESFEVEGKTPTEAYCKAEDCIKSLSTYLAEHYWELDIECLIDENGKYLHPDFFLKEDKSKKTSNKIFTVMYGPASAGKSLITKALRKFCNLDFYEPPVIKSKDCRTNREPRPEDIPFWDNPEYFLESDEHIRQLKDNPRYLVKQCRSNWQAFDLEEVANSKNPLIFRDLYYTFISSLKNSKYLEDKAEVKTLFISPFERERIAILDVPCAREYVHCMMSQRLALRSYKQKGDKAYSQAVMEDNEERALTACDEFEQGIYADIFVHNPFPEGHPAWNYDDKTGLFLKEPEPEAMGIVRKVERSLG